MSVSESIKWQNAIEMELARIEANLHFVDDYSSLMHIPGINLRAKQCLESIDEIKKYLILNERTEKESPPLH
jgi:hypothetical protein